jgi:glycine cleavage system H protein
MSIIPEGLFYTKDHEWVIQVSPSIYRMGITDFAQGALGDIVYVQLPKIGETVLAEKVCGEVESTKSVSEIFAPVSGKVIAVNEDLVSSPELLNAHPYDQGWMLDIEVTTSPAGLLSSEDYRQITA